jgi:fatty-acyl-CoA synthase
MAGATCPIEVMRRVIDQMHMAEVQIAYGMTETSPVSLQTGPDDDLELRVTTVGRTQPQLETSWWTPTAASSRAVRSANCAPVATA